MTIPHSRPWITPADQAAVADRLATGMLAEGALARSLEEAVAERLGGGVAVAAASGRQALARILAALDIGPGDEVLLPSYCCASVHAAVTALGATGIVCDVGEDWCIDPQDVARRISPRSRAIVAAHMFGVAADVDGLARLGFPVIEDCAQAVGGRDGQGRVLGSIGAGAILSFQATKVITTGHGGAAFTADPALGARLRQAAASGGATPLDGGLDDLQAALGLSQIARLDEIVTRRKALAAFYLEALDGVDAALPGHVFERSLFFRFPLRISRDFDTTRRAFEAQGVAVRRGVDALIHRQLGLDAAGFPGAEARFGETLSIPLYPALAREDAQRVVDACRRIL